MRRVELHSLESFFVLQGSQAQRVLALVDQKLLEAHARGSERNVDAMLIPLLLNHVDDDAHFCLVSLGQFDLDLVIFSECLSFQLFCVFGVQLAVLQIEQVEVAPDEQYPVQTFHGLLELLFVSVDVDEPNVDILVTYPLGVTTGVVAELLVLIKQLKILLFIVGFFDDFADLFFSEGGRVEGEDPQVSFFGGSVIRDLVVPQYPRAAHL